MNSYGYVSNYPLSFNDPLGLAKCDVLAALDFLKILELEYYEDIGLYPSADDISFAELGTDENGIEILGQTSKLEWIFNEFRLDKQFEGNNLTPTQLGKLLGTVRHETYRHLRPGLLDILFPDGLEPSRQYNDLQYGEALQDDFVNFRSGYECNNACQ